MVLQIILHLGDGNISIGSTTLITPTQVTATGVGAALNIDKSINLLPEMFKEAEKFRIGNKFSIPAAAAILLGVISLSGWTSINHEEMKNIHVVGEGKAKKYGIEFIKVIKDYVKKNNIMRNEEYTVKSTGSNSTLKLFPYSVH